MAAADTRAILRALKAATTPSPGSGALAPALSQGQSPLVASYNEWTSGHASGTSQALPREWQSFLAGAFGPGMPIQPVPIDVPEPGDDRATPRRYEYPISWDLPMGAPGTEGLGKLADFKTLRTLADLYSVARACIDMRKAELRGIGWDIALTKDAAKSLRGDKNGMADFASRRAKAVKFFRRPDPEYDDFSSWFNAILEEIFVTDALAVYVHPARGKGKGLLGSHIGALDLLDGTTIRPMVDIRGGTPQAPNVAYQQYEYGVPRADLLTLLTQDDEDGLLAEYTGDQLMYLRFTQRTWTPYGQANIEKAIVPVMSGLNRQQYQLNYFQEGSIPGLFVSPGDMAMTPAQIRELQDALNALAGDAAWKHKIIVLPGGSKVDPQKPAALADLFDEILMVQVCMAFNVMPMELGISPRVSATQSTGAANQMAKASQDIQERKGTVPLLMWLKASIFDRILQDVCGMEDLEWTWEGLEEDEDVETLTNLLVQQVGSGMRSIDEARAELGLDPWNMPATSDPGWATQMNGFVPFAANPAVDPVLQQQIAQNQLQSQQAGIEAQRAGTQAQQQGQEPGQPPVPGNQPPKPGQPASGTPGAKPPASGSKPPPKALPPAAGGRPATSAPRGAGSRNSPAVAGTPAHAAAAAGAAGSTAKKPVAKSTRELDLLRVHLRKGRPLAEWVPQDLPGALIAGIGEDLAKGLTPDEVCDMAAAGVGKAGGDDLTQVVYAYLVKHYPESVLGWVQDARWSGPVPVDLDDVNMARRNDSARDPAKVQAIEAAVGAGKKLAPVVLVRAPGQDELQIADGWHRTLALKHADRPSVVAYVGDVDTAHGPWDGEMNAAKLNKAGGADPKVPGWDLDREAPGLPPQVRRAVARRRHRLLTVHLDAVQAAWDDCVAGLKPRDLLGNTMLAGTAGKAQQGQEPWWKDVAEAAALAWLQHLYQARGYAALVAAIEAAIRAGMAEGEADALAAAAARQGVGGLNIAEAFAAAYGRLAGDPGVSRRAQAAIEHIVQGAAADLGRHLAAGGASAESVRNLLSGATRSVQSWLVSALRSALGAGVLSLLSQAGQGGLLNWVCDGAPCAACSDNEAGSPYEPGDVPPYPMHPNCQCEIDPAGSIPASLFAGLLS